MKTIPILVAHGVNLDLLGTREPALYGTQSLLELNQHLNSLTAELINPWRQGLGKPEFALSFFQSNHEGAFLEALKPLYLGIILNPGAWTHTSLAIADRLACLSAISIEVHLTAINQREPIRRRSFLKTNGKFMGMGFTSYASALFALAQELS
jgi:3-dehydroquinate dehydratase-2